MGQSICERRLVIVKLKSFIVLRNVWPVKKMLRESIVLFMIAELFDRLSLIVAKFDAVAVIDVTELSEIKSITTEIQLIPGVDRTETMIEVQ